MKIKTKRPINHADKKTEPSLIPEVWDPARDLTFAALAAVFAFLLFFPTLGYEFIWDDQPLILENPHVMNPSSPGDWLNPESFRFKLNDQSVFYRPISRFSLALDNALWGPNPAAFHLVNNFLHTLNTALVYILVWTLVRRRDWALVAALLFAAHPIHVEAVAWIKCRSELLAFLAGGTALLCSIRAVRGSRRLPWLLIAGLLFMIALMAKQTALGLAPLFTLCAAFLAPAGKSKEWILWSLPLWVLAIVYALLDHFFLSAGTISNPVVNGIILNPWQRIALIFESVYLYLKWLLIPWPLTPHHTPDIPTSLISFIWIKALLVIALFYAGVRLGLRKHWLGFALLWVLLALAPSSNLLPITGRSVAEQRNYFPSVGFCLGLAWAISSFADWMTRRRQAVFISFLTVIIAVTYTAITFSAMGRWKESLRFWETAVRENPGKLWMLRNLSAALILHGQPEQALNNLDQIVALTPEDGQAWEQRGTALHDLGRFPEAAQSIAKAWELGRQTALNAFKLGVCHVRLTEYEKAESWFRNALKMNSDFPDAEMDLADTLAARNRKEEALSIYNNLASRMPRDARVLKRLGMTQSLFGDYKPALENLSLAGQLNSRDPQICLEKGRVCLLIGDATQAADNLRQCVMLKPTLLEAWLLLVRALESLGESETARKCLEEAERIAPYSPEPPYLLGVGYLNSQELDMARKAFQRALKADPRHGPSLIGLGDIEQLSGRLASAETVYAKIDAMQNEYAEASARRINVLLRLKRNVEALAVAESAIASVSPPDSFYPMAAQALIAMGSPEAAWDSYQQYAGKTGCHPAVLLSYATTFYRMGQKEHAISIYGELLKLNPTDPDALDALTQIAMNLNQTELAIPHLEKALEVIPNNAQWHHNLGVLKGMAGDLDSAIRELKAAVGFEPDDEEFWFNLAHAYLQAGKKEDAESACLSGLQASPDAERGLLLHAQVSHSQGNRDETLRRLDVLLNHYPDNKEGRILRESLSK